MKTKTALNKAIDQLGLTPMAKELGMNYQAITGWRDRDRMPDTEYSGRTHHAVKIQKMSGGRVTVTMLLGHVPVAAKAYAERNDIQVS